MISPGEVLRTVSFLQHLQADDIATAQVFEAALEALTGLTAARYGLFLQVVNSQPARLVRLAESGAIVDLESPMDGRLLDASFARELLEEKAPVPTGLIRQYLPGVLEPLVWYCRVREQLIGIVIIDVQDMKPADLELVTPALEAVSQLINSYRMEQEHAKNMLKLESIINSAMHGVVTIDKTGSVKNFNHAAEEMFGFTEWEMLGNNISVIMPEGVAVRHDSYVDRYLTSREPRIIGSGRELEARRADGSIFPIHLGVSEVTLDGEPFFVGSIMDLSEEKRAQEELYYQKEQAERARNNLAGFVRSMGHELRTPLNAILGLSELLEGEASPDHPDKRKLHQILTSSRHLLHLINDIFDFSVIEDGQFVLQEARVDLRALLEECVEIIRARTDDRCRDIVIEWNPVGSEQSVFTDEARLKQILLNLLTNAVKYCRDDSIIRCGCEEHPGFVRLYVENEGVGIKPEEKERAFQPFDRLGFERSSIEGTGIGLALSRRLAEKMGVTLDCVSDPGATTRFWVDLPDAEALLPANLRAGASQAHEVPLRILYIEDNPVNVMVMEAIVEQRHNVALVSCTTGIEGVGCALNEDFDLVLTDINLPDIDGFEVFERIRRQKPELPVAAVSASAMAPDVTKGMSAGFDNYITKPIDVAEFWDAIGHLTQGRVGQLKQGD